MKICDLCKKPMNNCENYLFLKDDYLKNKCLKVDLCDECFYKVRNDIAKKLGWESDEQ